MNALYYWWEYVTPLTFPGKISEISQSFDEVKAYIDDVLTITEEDYDNHLAALERYCKG